MLSAYVLIQTEVGKVAHVAQALSDLDGVQLAEDLAGPYDVIAKVQAPGLDQLGKLVASRIQLVDGITRTLTCMVSTDSRATRRHRSKRWLRVRRTPVIAPYLGGSRVFDLLPGVHAGDSCRAA